jgi:hypothetical protein
VSPVIQVAAAASQIAVTMAAAAAKVRATGLSPGPAYGRTAPRPSFPGTKPPSRQRPRFHGPVMSLKAKVRKEPGAGSSWDGRFEVDERYRAAVKTGQKMCSDLYDDFGNPATGAVVLGFALRKPAAAVGADRRTLGIVTTHRRVIALETRKRNHVGWPDLYFHLHNIPSSDAAACQQRRTGSFS